MVSSKKNIFFTMIAFFCIKAEASEAFYPMGIKGSGLSSPFFLNGIERYSYHPSQDPHYCSKQHHSLDRFFKNKKYKEKTKKSENKSEIEGFFHMFPHLQSEEDEIYEEENHCHGHFEIQWPSIETSRTYIDIAQTSSDEDVALYLLDHIGDYHVFLYQVQIGYMKENWALGFETQESVSALIFNNIDALGLESVQIVRQRVSNGFYSMTKNIKPKLNIGLKTGVSYLGFFQNTSPITDVSALEKIKNIEKLKDSIAPLLDIALSWKPSIRLGIIYRNAIKTPYRKDVFKENRKNRHGEVDITIATPIINIYDLSIESGIDIFRINQPYPEDTLNKIHIGIKAITGLLEWQTGLNQGHLSNALSISSDSHKMTIGHIGYEHDENLGFRQSERLFFSWKSLF